MKHLFALLLLAAAVGITPAATAAGNAPRPNFVVLLADDLGSHDVGWRGSEIRTPNLDGLAASGAKLERFYVQPVCSPTRAAQEPGKVRELRRRYARWAKQAVPPQARPKSKDFRVPKVWGQAEE